MTSPSKGETNQLLSAALAYADRGWRVFPLQPRDKVPFPKTQGFKEGTSDRSRVLQWWQLFPDANIGLATGEPFDALDIDGPSGVPALQELLGADYRHTGPVVSTGKGRHLYFAALGSGNRAGLLGGKVDYRGSGGYVVAPPSIHPSGRVYCWDQDRGPDRPLPLVPENLQGILVKPRAAVVPTAISKQLPGGSEAIAATQRAQYATERPDILMVAASMGLQTWTKGLNYVTNCIFHPDPGPSMVLYTGQNKFYCFGCEAHGDSRDLAARLDMTGRPAL